MLKGMTKAKIKKLKSILQLLEDNKDEDDSDEPDLEMAKEGQWKKIEDEAARKKIKENECKKKDEVKRQEQLQVKMSEEDEQKKIQEIVRHNLAVHCSVTPFIIQQPIWRPRLLERVYKPMHTSH